MTYLLIAFRHGAWNRKRVKNHNFSFNPLQNGSKCLPTSPVLSTLAVFPYSKVRTCAYWSLKWRECLPCHDHDPGWWCPEDWSFLSLLYLHHFQPSLTCWGRRWDHWWPWHLYSGNRFSSFHYYCLAIHFGSWRTCRCTEAYLPLHSASLQISLSILNIHHRWITDFDSHLQTQLTSFFCRCSLFQDPLSSSKAALQ